MGACRGVRARATLHMKPGHACTRSRSCRPRASPAISTRRGIGDSVGSNVSHGGSRLLALPYLPTFIFAMGTTCYPWPQALDAPSRLAACSLQLRLIQVAGSVMDQYLLMRGYGDRMQGWPLPSTAACRRGRGVNKSRGRGGCAWWHVWTPPRGRAGACLHAYVYAWICADPETPKRAHNCDPGAMHRSSKSRRVHVNVLLCLQVFNAAKDSLPHHRRRCVNARGSSSYRRLMRGRTCGRPAYACRAAQLTSFCASASASSVCVVTQAAEMLKSKCVGSSCSAQPAPDCSSHSRAMAGNP